MSKARASTARTGRMTWPWTRCCWPERPQAGRSGCSGPGRTRCAGPRSAPPCWLGCRLAWTRQAGVAQLAGWGTRDRPDGTGFGVAVARYKGVAGYCAAVAEVEADTDVRLRRLWLAVDVGRVINPDGVRNQVEGGAVQSASWTLREQVRFDRDRITSANWDSYPIMRFT